MDLHDALEKVSDRPSFLHFARLLAEDKARATALENISPAAPFSPGANGWENGTIEAFLEAAIAWAEATDFGLAQGLAAANPWKQFAVFLYCGKIYE